MERFAQWGVKIKLKVRNGKFVKFVTRGEYELMARQLLDYLLGKFSQTFYPFLQSLNLSPASNVLLVRSEGNRKVLA